MVKKDLCKKCNDKLQSLNRGMSNEELCDECREYILELVKESIRELQLVSA